MWTSIDETLAHTVADLVGGALSRTRLHDEERAVLRRIQHSLLSPPPDVPGFEMSVGYRSALTAIDMGGDWYSIIDAPDAIYAVIGDIAGHGPGAVALMAEVKTVIRHLLATGSSMNEAVAHADRTLQRRHAYASMLITRIDKHTDRLEYLNAGHPPAVCFTGAAIVALADVHRPWLGVAPRQQPTTSLVTFEPGDLLVLYTDGLVEQRDEPIDDSIRTHLHTIDTTPPTQRIVDHLLSERERRRTPGTTDDDIAVITIRRTRESEPGTGASAVGSNEQLPRSAEDAEDPVDEQPHRDHDCEGSAQAGRDGFAQGAVEPLRLGCVEHHGRSAQEEPDQTHHRSSADPPDASHCHDRREGDRANGTVRQF
jgi:hypothetical protein